MNHGNVSWLHLDKAGPLQVVELFGLHPAEKLASQLLTRIGKIRSRVTAKVPTFVLSSAIDLFLTGEAGSSLEGIESEKF